MHWKDLGVWEKSHILVKKIYKVTAGFPKDELYGLTNQIKRASISVPTNIVEGFSRNSTKEYIKFLFNSRGSLEEIRYLLLLSSELQFMENKTYLLLESTCEEISKMLNALITSLRHKIT
ncbi:MAG: four helix bundle protein [Candidatus Ratteibacteria bacterium]|nr:four helix bundle protein [Candidatus Ratteibacteria bacterium]